MTQRTPFEVDTELAELYREYDKADRDRTAHVLYLGLMVFGRDSEASVTDIIEAAEARIGAGDDRNISYGIGAIARTLAAMNKAIDTIITLQHAIALCDQEYIDAGSWSRFFLATSHNGHVHSSMNCSTCNRNGQSTSFAWLPELSGKSEAQAVEEWGEKMCTVCFPSAPTDPNFNRPSRRDREAAEAKAAEKAAKEAEKAAKGITNPDGTELVVGSGWDRRTLKTLVAAQRMLAERLWSIRWYRAVDNDIPHPDEPKWLADVDVLIAAIAHKTGEDAAEIRKAAQDKAAKKVAADLRKASRR